MKKFAILVLAGLLAAVFAMPASAMEHVFGGYWDTRAWMQENFDGNDDDQSEAGETTAVETRGRLYYTAIFHEDLKFVTKFEMDAIYGDNNKKNTYGDIGADNISVEVKNSYVDFNLGPVNTKVGIQGMVLARGFLLDADVAGAVVSYNSDMMTLPFMWIKAYEGGEGLNKRDVDYFAVAPSFSPSDMLSITPYFLYAYSERAKDWEPTSIYEEVKMFYGGLDLDANLGPASVWLTGIYQGGEAELASDPDTTHDFKAWLGAVGASVDMGFADIHGEFFYATGQDPDEKDKTKFFVPDGQSYYWGEIMGYGKRGPGLGDRNFGKAVNGSPNEFIGNIMAANLGTTIKPTNKLSITLDAWYGKLAEEATADDPNGAVAGEDELGIEADVIITYQLVKGLQLDLVGAYLFAGDAVYKGDGDTDPYEIGTCLSLSF